MHLKKFSSIIGTVALAAVAFARPELFITEDQRGLIFIGSFGFLPGGVLDMNLQDLKVVPYEGDKSEEKRIGFLIQKGASDADTVDWENGCILDDPYFKDELDNGRSEFLPLDTAKKEFLYHHQIQPGEEEMWNMLFVNCPRSIVSYRLKTLEVNPNNNYLSAGDIPLPKVYAGAAIAYFGASVLWLSMLLKRDTKVFWPHRLIFVLAVMIGIQKTFQAVKSYKDTYTDLYDFAIISIKPFLSQKDKKIILIIIPLQTQVFPMVDLISCIVILGVIIQTQRHLSEAAETEGKVAENKSKYKLWGSFYLITVVYIYLTRIMVEFLKVALPYQYVQWLVELLNEAITLGFYATIGWKFRPYANNPYTLIDEDDNDHDIESSMNEGETHGLQTMSRREVRTNEHDE
ncbi:hypothetical protein BGX27_005264 [Mortierella sp. AM989]|nr:hypothetical protein BGX27_005264 [Mortierella sp. AM989]